MKTRLLGAAVLIVLAVLFVPMFFSSSPPSTSSGDQTVSLAIPPAPDRDLQTKTMSLTPEANRPAGASARSALPPPAAATVAPAAPSNQLATVNIGSSRPRDVETDPNAGKVEPTTVTRPGAAAQQALIPAQVPGAAAATHAGAGKPAVPAQPAPDLPAATAARGNYTINLSAYSGAGAQRLMQRVRGMGYPVEGRPINRAGQNLTLVSAGPFESRAAAEAARLKIGQAVSGVKPTLESGASTPTADAPPAALPRATPPNAAAPAPAPGHRAGGYAVQVAAVGSQADATSLRDKLRANGFDGFVDSVNVNGKQLWRVRAGPQTQRADAERLRDQIKAKLGMAGNVVGVP